jgi:hypothetical protein
LTPSALLLLATQTDYDRLLDVGIDGADEEIA